MFYMKTNLIVDVYKQSNKKIKNKNTKVVIHQSLTVSHSLKMRCKGCCVIQMRLGFTNESDGKGESIDGGHCRLSNEEPPRLLNSESAFALRLFAD